MRNIIEYPITSNEVIDLLFEYVIDKPFQEPLIGDMKGYILSKTIDFIKINYKEYEKFLNSV